MSDRNQSGATGATYTVTAMFDNRADADEAVNALIKAGFDRDHVRLVPGTERDVDVDPEVRRSQGSGDPGFWTSLRELFLPGDDSSLYAEGLRRGGYLVSVRTTSATHDRAVDILDDEGTIDLDERAQSWRTEGWTGYTDIGEARTGSGMASGSGAPRTEATSVADTGRVKVHSHGVAGPAGEDVRRTDVEVRDDRSSAGSTGRDTDRRSR